MIEVYTLKAKCGSKKIRSWDRSSGKSVTIIKLLYRNAPYVGMLTIWLNDYPMLKYAVIGLMFITVLVSKDPQS